jgi:hypothetical protein
MEDLLEKAAKDNKSAVNLDDVNLYDELKESKFDTEDQSEKEQRQTMTKNLSLKLLDTKTPDEVLRIFENEFVRQA